MPTHHETRFLPYRPDQLFALVAAVDRYPEFLPWCKAARILSRDQDGRSMVADLVIGYKIFAERFRSNVILDHPHAITVTYVSGPLAHLSNRWEFKPAQAGGCDLSFAVDFDFRSPLLRAAMQVVFDKALTKMVGAFETRAQDLYGQSKSVPSSDEGL